MIGRAPVFLLLKSLATVSAAPSWTFFFTHAIVWHVWPKSSPASRPRFVCTLHRLFASVCHVTVSHWKKWTFFVAENLPPPIFIVVNHLANGSPLWFSLLFTWNHVSFLSIKSIKCLHRKPCFSCFFLSNIRVSYQICTGFPVHVPNKTHPLNHCWIIQPGRQVG